MAKLKHYNQPKKYTRKDNSRRKYTCFFLHDTNKSLRDKYNREQRAKSKNIVRQLIQKPYLEDRINNNRTGRGTALYDSW